MNFNEIITIVNELANITICLSMILFIIFVFGRLNSKMNQLPIVERTLVKLGLILICCGSLYNFLICKQTDIFQTIMNLGIALVFSWGAYFHFKYFIKKNKKK